MRSLDFEASAQTGAKLLAEAEGIALDLVEWRRSFHQFPEIGMEEHMTSNKIEGLLSSMPGMEVTKGFGLSTCVIGKVGGDLAGGALAFRAELDAVEVREDTGLPFSSYDERVSHVQGHDAHMASLLGTAMLLSDHRAQLRHPVVFIFQPADEGKGGSRYLIDAGLQEKFNIEKMLCVHWVPYLPYGQVFTNKGGVTSFTNKLHIGLSGEGGHGSTPHLTADPLYLSALIQVALQSILTREVDPQKTAVLSFGRIDAAEVYNVIAEEVDLWGTLRTTDRELHRYLKRRIEDVVRGMAHIAHVAASVEYTLDYGQVLNNEELVSRIFKIGTALIGSEAMSVLKNPLLVGEDFCYFAERIPSCLMFLGTGMEYGLYHARYDIPENLLPFASAWGAYLALFL
ncbi:MAG: amidohydrolase [Synergistaceae bacterium]|jgi:amidohydrolase|nr:amidohydrolase [Synergistaceae bacterium]